MSELISNTSHAIQDAKVLYESLKRSSQKDEKIKNLDKLWQILNDIRESGERDFSLAEIGRRLEKVGGLKTQSLRNKQGKDFRDLLMY